MWIFLNYFFFLISVCIWECDAFQVYCLSVSLSLQRGHGSQRRHWKAAFCSAFTSILAHLMELKGIILLVSYEGKTFSMTRQHDCALIWYFTEMFRRGLATHSIDSLELRIWKMAESAVGKLIWNGCSPTAELWHFENISLSPHVRQNRVLALKIKLSWSECSIIWYAAVCEAALNYNPFYSGPPIIQVCVYSRVCVCTLHWIR